MEMCRYSALAVVTLALAPVSFADVAGQDVGTPDVELVARSILQDLEVLRWQMGRPIETRDPIPVTDVAIRENFAQAMTLWRKVNQLGVELVGGGESPPVVMLVRGAVYGPAHVLLVLTGIRSRLEEVREGVGVVGAAPIAEAFSAPTPNPDATPSDVFRDIVQANRQANRMLEREFQPGDVYQQVQQAVFYASAILTAVDDEVAFPTVPAYEPGHTPIHVHAQLMVAFDRLSAAFDELGLDMLRWSAEAYSPDEPPTPSDVFDLATLLLSELEYLHAQVPGAPVPLQAAHPGRRWPSNVYQQAGVLTQQTTRILVQATQNPAFTEGR